VSLERGHFEAGRWVEVPAPQILPYDLALSYMVDNLVAGAVASALKSAGRPGRFIHGAWVPDRSPLEVRILVAHLQAKPRETWTDEERQAWRETEILVETITAGLKSAIDNLMAGIREALAPAVESLAGTVRQAGQAIGRQWAGIASALAPALSRIEPPPRGRTWAERMTHAKGARR
jgi:hypothetical protein